MREPLIIFLSLLLSAISCSPPPDQQVLARVNGEKVRVGEFLENLRREAAQYDSSVFQEKSGLEILKRRVANDIIREKLILQAASREKIEVTADELQPILNSLRSGYSHQDFEELLEKKGVSLADWEERQRKKRTIEKWFDHLLAQNRPSEEQLEKTYRANPRQYKRPERSHCRQIVTSSEEKAEKLLSLIRKGENFAAVAHEYSESPDREKWGDLGYVVRGDLPPIMDEACFRFEPGATSGVVRSAYGYHIFRVIDKEPERLLSFDEARLLVLEKWREERRDDLIREWLEQELQRSKIEIDEEVLNRTTLPL